MFLSFIFLSDSPEFQIADFKSLEKKMARSSFIPEASARSNTSPPLGRRSGAPG
jgi:hypothetical protein